MPEFAIAWGVAGAAGVLALALAIRVGTEGGRTAALRNEFEELRKAAKASRKHEGQRESALRRAEAELDKASRKLAQRDKREAQSKGNVRSEREAANDKIRSLEAEALEAAARLDALATELSQSRAEFDATVQRANRAEAQAQAADSAAAAMPPPADPEELRVLRERSESAEQKLAERDDALAQASAEVERFRHKAQTQEILYTSVRSELSLKKDQIRQQRAELERLQAVRVSLIGIDRAEEPGE
jgi:hypothetical protein